MAEAEAAEAAEADGIMTGEDIVKIEMSKKAYLQKSVSLGQVSRYRGQNVDTEVNGVCGSPFSLSWAPIKAQSQP